MEHDLIVKELWVFQLCMAHVLKFDPDLPNKKNKLIWNFWNTEHRRMIKQFP